jgi:hypothetical protein
MGGAAAPPYRQHEDIDLAPTMPPAKLRTLFGAAARLNYGKQ